MIRCINRLKAHQEGKIVVHGTELTNDLKNIDLIRKNVGMVRLRHGATKGRLWVVGTHLMTESRDNKKLTKYNETKPSKGKYKDKAKH